MGLRFRQTFTLFPGIRLNLSKSGISASFGVPGATVNIGPQGLISTVGLPGTGLSYRTQHSFTNQKTRQNFAEHSPQFFDLPTSEPLPRIPPAYWHATSMREIGSASVEQLTSQSLQQLRNMIADARAQRSEIESDLQDARTLHRSQSDECDRRRRSIFRYFYKGRIAELEANLPVTEKEVRRLEGWLDATHVEIEFETAEAAKKAYGALVRAFDTLRGSAIAWDITSDRKTDRVLERTTATRTLTRDRATVDFSASDLVRFEGRGMRFENVNGEDILIFPGMAMMPRADGAFALIDLRELRVEFDEIQFIESDAVPNDTEVVGHVWAKANKDGSPDLRFKDNYQIPVCVYGRLLFTSPSGVEEEYQFSNSSSAMNFARAFDAYQAALSSE